MSYLQSACRQSLFALWLFVAIIAMENVGVSQEIDDRFLDSLLPGEQQVLRDLPDTERLVAILRLKSASRGRWWFVSPLKSSDWKSWEAGSVGNLELKENLPVAISDGREPLEDKELREMSALRKLEEIDDRAREEMKAEATQAAKREDAELRAFGTAKQQLEHAVALKGVEFLRAGGLASNLPDRERELTYSLLKKWENALVWDGESGGRILMRATTAQMRAEGRSNDEISKLITDPVSKIYAKPLLSYNLYVLGDKKAALWTGEEWFMFEGDIRHMLSLGGLNKESTVFFHSDTLLLEFIGFGDITTQSGSHTVPKLRVLDTSSADDIAQKVLARNGFHVWSRKQFCNTDGTPINAYGGIGNVCRDLSRHSVGSLDRKSQKFVYTVTPQGKKERITIEFLTEADQQWLRDQ